MNNPYTNRGAIKNPKEFYGREREVRRIYSRISSSHPQCLSIIGERKIGKSSLLYYISHEDTLKRLLKGSDSYLFLLLDLQERGGNLSFLSFFHFIFEALVNRLGSSVIPPSLVAGAQTETACYEAFKKVVLNIESQGFKLILLFDEFGMITRNEQFDPSFFSFLRSIANNHECAYITTSRERLQKICHNSDISESPFFNIFTPVPLGPFEVEEARSLISKPSQESGVSFEDREVEFILSIAGCHPVFIQMACAALFDHKTEDGSGLKEADFEAVKSGFLLEASEQFEQIWQDADKVEQQLLDQILMGEKVESHQAHLVRDLQRKGYLTDNDPPHFLSQAFAEFLASKHPNFDLKKIAAAPRPILASSEASKGTSLFSKVASLFKGGTSKAKGN